MKIAYLSTQTEYYGGEVHLCNLAAGMRARGHDVQCVVRPDSALARQLTANDVPVYRLPLVDWYEPVGMVRLWRWLRREQVQILHTHTPRDHYIAALATATLPIGNVGSRHQLQPFSKPRLKRPFLRRIGAMIAVSDAVHDGILRSRVVDPARVITIYNGVDTARSLPERDGLRDSLGLDSQTLVVGFVGRLCPTKGIETLLAAGQLLVHDGWDRLRIFILGDDPRGGSYESFLRQRAGDLGLQRYVHFFGYVDDAERASADFDVQVVASEAEPFGLVTLEGMANRHPVVATASGGSPEIITDGVDGYLVAPDDPSALAARLDDLLRQPELRRVIGHRARERVERVFSLTHMLARTEAVYRSVLDGTALPV